MKKSRIFLTIITLTLVLLVFTGCKGVVPPSPGTTEDITVISGKIKMPLTCCAPLEEISKDGGNNNDCDEVEFWPFTPNAVVELRSAAKGQCKKPPVTTYTDEDGNYVFEDVKPGLYIITAYCPEEAKKGFFLKDVAEKIHGVALDAGIPDCTSTSLALVIEKINNCYNDWYHCYNKLTKIYKLIDTIAKDVGKVDIAAIINHDKFGDYCDDVNDDLVDLVCAFSCCESPGATGGGGGGGPTLRASLEVTKIAEPKNFSKEGEVITYTITVENTGNVAITDLEVTDPKTGNLEYKGGDEDSNGKLDVGETWTYKVEYTITNADLEAGEVENIATAAGKDPGGNDVTGSGTETVNRASLEVTKTADKDQFSTKGEVITYTITVENTGNVTLTDVKIEDLDPGIVFDDPSKTSIASLAPGEIVTATATHAITQEDLNAGYYTNTAKATGKDPGGNEVKDEGSVTVPYKKVEIKVTKEADPKTFSGPNQKITYTIKVKNTGEVAITDLTVTDSKIYAGNLIRTSVEGGNNDNILDVGETWTYEVEYTTTTADVTAEQIENTAKAFGKDPGGNDVTGSDTETVDKETPCTYELTLYANPEAGGTVSEGGTFTAGTEVDILATPNEGEGWKFAGWSVHTGSNPHDVNNTDSASTKVTMNGDMTLTANFVPDIYEGGTLTIAYEDMPDDKSSDYDYNDWVVSIIMTPHYEEGSPNLKSITFDITPKARGAGHDHKFYIKIPKNTFSSNGTYNLVITGDSGSKNDTFNANNDMVFKVIPDTRKSLGNESGNTTNTVKGSNVSASVTAKLTITFNTAFYYDFGQFDPYSSTSMHGEGLFFDPYIKVYPKSGSSSSSYEVRKGDARILTVPVDWRWPLEGIPIWEAYSSVTAGIPPLFSSAWWTNPDLIKVY